MNNKQSIKIEILDHCPLCGHRKLTEEMCVEDFETHTGTYAIAKCDGCGTCFTNPRPAGEGISQLYEDRSTSDFPDHNTLTVWLRRLSIWFKLRRQLKDNDLSILDYGCGDGFLSLQLAQNPRCRQITAVDFHGTPPALIQNKDKIRYLPHPDFLNVSEAYDIIFCRHVLEHMQNPLKWIMTMKGRLKPQGRIIAEVPNYSSIWKTVFGKYYFGLYVPRHLFHFTPQTFERLFQNFDYTHMRGKHTPLLGRSLGYKLNAPIHNIGLSGLTLFPIQVLADMLVGKSSTLEITAGIKK
jgi:2-polyprenyl-3-methyl-5-hydroxy-6-metoxy-1,4-benzoquinol methylase